MTIEELRQDVFKRPLAEFERAVFLYCGEPVSIAPSGKQRSYCACHAALAYRQPSKAEKAIAAKAATAAGGADRREARRIECAAVRAERRIEIDACELTI